MPLIKQLELAGSVTTFVNYQCFKPISPICLYQATKIKRSVMRGVN